MSISPWGSSCSHCLPCGALHTEWRETNTATINTQADYEGRRVNRALGYSIETKGGVAGG